MNSEPWRDPLQELWQRQPTPAAPERAEERILRAVQAAEDQARREAGDYADIAWWLLPLLWLPNLVSAYFTHPEFFWGEWLLQVSLWAILLGIVVMHQRRRRYERDFGPTLLGRIELGCALLRMRMKWNHLNLVGAPFLALALALSVHAWTHGSGWAAVVTGAIALPGLGGWMVRHWRKHHTEMQRRLAALEAMRAELTQ